jgi:hypothetical protein
VYRCMCLSNVSKRSICEVCIRKCIKLRIARIRVQSVNRSATTYTTSRICTMGGLKNLKNFLAAKYNSVVNATRMTEASTLLILNSLVNLKYSCIILALSAAKNS